MKKALPILIIIVIIVAIGGCSYNGMNSARLNVDNAWSKVQSDYQRRADLIPNLVGTVKGAADFEKNTYVQVAQARAGQLRNLTQTTAENLTPQRLQDIQNASAQAGQAMRMAINIAVEAYPQLRATQNFTDLQNQLEGTENRIKFSRDGFNDAVLKYNKKVSNFPGNLMAGMFGFKQRPMFQADAGADHAPKVQF
ncbi:MAG: LemA family protein [Bacteroidetes bacterium]|nr:LemA family protein [Bacteroidota bacterium]MBS1629880.1 LemA family protein [Bacteroidota bacterium]